MLVIPRGYVPQVSFNCYSANSSAGDEGVVWITWVACSTADVVINAKLKTGIKPKETSNFRAIHNLDREGCHLRLISAEPYLNDTWSLVLHGLVGPKGAFLLEVWDNQHARTDVELRRVRDSAGIPTAPDRNILWVDEGGYPPRTTRMEWHSEPLTEGQLRQSRLDPVRSVRESL